MVAAMIVKVENESNRKENIKKSVSGITDSSSF